MNSRTRIIMTLVAAFLMCAMNLVEAKELSAKEHLEIGKKYIDKSRTNTSKQNPELQSAIQHIKTAITLGLNYVEKAQADLLIATYASDNLTVKEHFELGRSLIGTLGDPYGLANTVASTFNSTIQALIKTKLDAQIAAETDATKKAALQAKLDESQNKQYKARLQSVWRSPRHNMEEGGSATSYHMRGAAADLAPEPLPEVRLEANNTAQLAAYYGLTYHEVWCDGLYSPAVSSASEVLNELPGRHRAHIPCTSYTGYDHVHVGNRGCAEFCVNGVSISSLESVLQTGWRNGSERLSSPGLALSISC